MRSGFSGEGRLRDRYGREVRGLRISVTSRCNLRCFYCHNEGCANGEREMTPEEIGEIAGIGAEFGIRSVKLTGGEPLLRDDILSIVREISGAGCDDISMTTNGVLLSGMASRLRDAGLTRVNISLDTLDPDAYEKITGSRSLGDVLSGVEAAVEAGLNPVKINMVLLAGINEKEVHEMMEYAFESGAVLQLIELVNLNEEVFRRYHVDIGRYEEELRARAVRVLVRNDMQARRKYVLPGGEVEVVRPVHNTEFCAHCTRIRVTPDGYMKPCLMRSDRLFDVASHIRSKDRSGAVGEFLRAIEAREPFCRAAVGDGG